MSGEIFTWGHTPQLGTFFARTNDAKEFAMNSDCKLSVLSLQFSFRISNQAPSRQPTVVFRAFIQLGAARLDPPRLVLEVGGLKKSPQCMHVVSTEVEIEY